MSNLPLVNNVVTIPAGLLPQEKTPCPALSRALVTSSLLLLYHLQIQKFKYTMNKRKDNLEPERKSITVISTVELFLGPKSIVVLRQQTVVCHCCLLSR